MKRPQNMPNNPTTINDVSKTIPKKKLKTTVEKQQVRLVEEKKVNDQDPVSVPVAAAVVADGMMSTGCYEWGGGGVAVDEQMSWGAMWFPSWDVDFMGEDSYQAICMDAWDGDIWDLRSINQVPNR